MKDPILVPAEVLRAIEAVRDGGTHNMFDYHGVMREMHNHDLHAGVVWMADHRRDYAQGIVRGFAVDEGATAEGSDGGADAP
jgi:hypothetical protein